MRRRTSALLVGLVAALLASPSAAGAAEARVAEARAAASSAPALVGVRIAGAVTGPAVADGTFVVVRETGEVYRVVGGAPVYVSTWSVFGGPQPVTPISSAQLAALPRTPADGTLVVGAPRGEVYRFVGGAPLYVSSWSAFGGPQPVTAVDVAALDNAGRPGPWSQVRATPADGTFVVGAQRGEVYRFVGGAPLYVLSWAPFGGAQPVTAVDVVALDNAGAGGVWDHVRPTPADGTFVVGAARGEVHRFAGGAPVYVTSFAAFGGPPPLTYVHDAALDNAGAGGGWNHVRFYPADGTLLSGAQTGRVYQVVGGVALYVAAWGQVGGPQPTTVVDQVAVDGAGLGGINFIHLRGTGTL